MTLQITTDEFARTYLNTDNGIFTIIPADFGRIDALGELGTLHSECEEIDESTESYREWLSAFESACPQWKA
tara:strand:+ start:328 stop:543 length:216 start_codon:yes stop_codon:yes gene_type:complete